MAQLKFQSPKGIRDVLPDEQKYWFHIERTIQEIVQIYGYEKLSLPVFEDTALYQRGIGEGADIVEKEMYTFEDRSGDSMTLRPEFTAGVMRSFLQNGMASRPKPVKLWSTGPVFRYERPQAGRFRQHTQFNVEALGEQDPTLDFEIMSIAWQLYDTLGFENLNFQINSIGCKVCRPNFLDQLVHYYKQHENEICDDCKVRLQKNPLRLLDCKKAQCQPIIHEAPSISNTLCPECEEHFTTLKGYLDEMKRPYTLNHRLVRGLDYYTKTVFEVWAQGIGAQNAVGGGGRYDGLAEILGGPSTPGIGFASGMERIVMTLQHQNVEVPEVKRPVAYFAAKGTDAKKKAVELLAACRNAGIPSIIGFGDRSLKAQMREANKRMAQYVIFLGEDEIAEGKASVKPMGEGEQQLLMWSDVVPFLQQSYRNS